MVPRRRGIEIRGRWLEACPAVCGRKLVGARRRAPGAGRSGRWRSSGSGVGGLRGRRRDLARSTGPAQDAEVKERRRWRLQLGNTAGTRSRRGAGMVYLPPPTGLVHPRPRESQQVWFITRPRQFLQFRVRTSSSSSRGIMDRGVHMVREDFDRQVLQQRESMDHRLKTNREDIDRKVQTQRASANLRIQEERAEMDKLLFQERQNMDERLKHEPDIMDRMLNAERYEIDCMIERERVHMDLGLV
ncbi:hypothetical protein PAHAL_4G285900 [Panicum hallii]|uniref:Uncharacterized protein n=1 Tax=Panicum hallii TaxID=206008 RepID=A0A2T8JE79_9POAL|nr:uncharacterized protein LOC112890140 isoform X2 [Panicum hallii]PVH48232.1 hypothetical protein PAHAL_4G285900 [Panicum hallii]